MPDLTEFCPAKINPYLAVTGKRDDGFHDLVSVVSQLSVGDYLEVNATDGGFSLTCDDSSLPMDGRNLVIRAAEIFRELSGWAGGAEFHLRKILPSGAGLGGGSSDAVAALRALNRVSGGMLGAEAMHEAAARVGSDCPLFLQDQAVIMRGRGERVEVAPAVTRRMAGREVLLVKPAFGVNTAWAYRRLAARAPDSYQDSGPVEEAMRDWGGSERDLSALGFNAFWPIAAEKFPALPAMATQLWTDFGVHLQMSGSGSACFLWLDDSTPVDAIVAHVQQAWGRSTWIERASCLPVSNPD